MSNFSLPAPQKPNKPTPMFEQYMRIKEEYPHALLFYRMGDFYELFYDDALTASRELQLTLTSRNAGLGESAPMCGVPHHSSENYLGQLLEKGFTVAICDQVEDPRTAKGLVKRAVTRVLTPGTAVEDCNLDSKGHNYLGSIYWDATISSGGFAWVDYSTGEWSGLFSKKEADLWQWVQKLLPRELLTPDMPDEAFHIPKVLSSEGIQTVRVPVKAFFDLRSATEKVLSAQGVADLAALGLDNKEGLTRACGALLTYLAQTQKQEIAHLAMFSPLNISRRLILDEVTERNLELFRRLDGRKGAGTLRHVLDQTVTPMGARMLEERLRHPWRDMEPIRETQDAVAFLMGNDILRERLRATLSAVYDLERLSTRITLNRAAPRDFSALRQSLLSLPAVRETLLSANGNTHNTSNTAAGNELPSALRHILSQWDDLSDHTSLLARALNDTLPPVVTEGGLFRPGYNVALDELLDLTEHGEQKLQELLIHEQKTTGFAKLKLGYNRVFGHYFELSRANVQNLPERFLRRQTLANVERFITPELKDLEEKLLTASEKRHQLEYTLFQQLRETLSEARPRLLFAAGLLSVLDYWQSLAEVARIWDWKAPAIHEGADIRIRMGRHPVVEAVQGRASFVPNDLRIDEKRRLIIITGPNMAGKSTVLRQTALMIILAQMGSFVPAEEAEIGLADRIFSRVGASDNLAHGQSTFMVEMTETARILRQAGPRSFVILDEIGRGTSTFDGMALAWAVVENLVKLAGRSVRTLFATHYHELTALEGRIDGIHNMNIAVREAGGEILFLRRLVPGPSDRSYGIEVARLAGVPQPVVQRARHILGILEKERGSGVRQENVKITRQLLPGMPLPEQESEKSSHPPEQQAKVQHPLLATLQDVDVNRLTPLRALELLHEWKLLWGEAKS